MRFERGHDGEHHVLAPVAGRDLHADGEALTSRLDLLRQALDAEGFDAIVCPPDALPALTHGSGWYLADALSYAALYNLLGMPAGVVAATRVRRGEESDRADGRDFVERLAKKVEAGSEGLPVGVQVAARHWREDVALAVMAALETHFKSRADYPKFINER